MKKLVILSTLVLFFASCSKKETPSGNVHFTGTIEGLSQGKLYVQKLKDSTLEVIDTIVVEGGKYDFETYFDIESPQMIYVFLDRGQTNSIDNNLEIFAEPGTINLKTTLKAFFADAKVTGSKNHDLYVKYNEMRNKFSNKNLELIKREIENKKENSVAVNDSIKKVSEKLRNRRYLFTANFAVTNANKEIAPYLALTEIADINIAFLDTIQSKLKPEVAKSFYGKKLKEYIKERKKLEGK